jgi:prevent-host-death family protein
MVAANRPWVDWSGERTCLNTQRWYRELLTGRTVIPIIKKRVPEVLDMKVSSAEFQKKFDALSDQARTEQLTITRNGRDELVLLSIEEYERLKRRDRRVVLLEDFTDEEMALIAEAEVPAEYAHLDAELKDWQP